MMASCSNMVSFSFFYAHTHKQITQDLSHAWPGWSHSLLDALISFPRRGIGSFLSHDARLAASSLSLLQPILETHFNLESTNTRESSQTNRKISGTGG